ncbi:helix-turn-helix domain-containing protein [Morganella morganii]|uniref:helix-turn-helix domain-containing protein n=1 Tax=Morganella morganii TaxID=582 RepID=UPI00339C9E5F
MQLSRQDLTHLFVREGHDWSSKAIYAALEQRGLDLTALETENGLKPGTMRNVFYRSYPRVEEIIAHAIGIDPAVIWPNRYQDLPRFSDLKTA